MSPDFPRDEYTPRPEHRFTFGLWTVGNPGRDAFGEAVRAPIAPTRIVEKLIFWLPHFDPLGLPHFYPFGS